ncbi:MAG: amidohydrolase family protein, partial [Actinobacteria bacterium]|nr:amidohydrolase family protein [Actinomycetota bacterium]
EIGDVIRDGIPTIKTLTTYGWMSDDGHRLGIMSEVAEHGGLSVVHAEDDAIARWLTAKYLREGKTHGAYIVETRGPLVEEAAVRRCMLLAEHTGSPLYVLHVAAGSAAAAIGEGRARGLPVYGETIIAYLSFTAEALWDDENRGLLWNNYPVIKYQEDQDLLWEAVAEDRLQVVSSDHFTTTVADRYEKMGSTVDSLQAGQAAVEMRVPVLYHRAVQEGRISLNRFVELVSTNPAKIMGLYPRKGIIAVGSDADIVVIDPARTWTVRWQDHHMSADYNCWEGWELKGKVTTSILRGSVLVENEEWVGSKTGGRFLSRTLLPQVVGRAPDLSATFASAQASVAAGSRSR